MSPTVHLDSEGASCDNCRAACCYTWIIAVDAEDLRNGVPEALTDPLPRSQFDDVNDQRSARMMKRSEGTHACVALDEETNRCTIYDRRPRVCRDFRVGSIDCVTKALREKGIDPRLPREEGGL